MHSLVYWWRDYGRVSHYVDGVIDKFFNTSLKSYSPCYLNFNSPADIGLGTDLLNRLANFLESVFGKVSATALLADCLAPPTREIELPRDL